MFEVIGHRGAGTLLPENTLGSFFYAYELGCPVVELDIQLTSDGQAAVFHDPILDNTTNGSGPLVGYTLKELKKLDAGEGRVIPELKEVLLSFKESGLMFQIELKGEGTDYIVPDIVKKNIDPSRVRFTSFIHKRVKHAVDYCGSHGGLLMSSIPMDPIGMLEQADAEYLHLNRHYISKEIVELIHRNNKKIIAWNNIISEDEFQAILDLGVDGATTDRPDLFLKFLNRYNRDN